MKKFNIVYQITNKINGKIYIGCHQTDNLYDKYMGSGKILQHAFKKYGIEKFTKIILENFDTPKKMFEKEKELVNEQFIKRKDTYNISQGGKKPPGTKGKVIVINENGNPICISKNDPRFLSKRLKGVAAGKVTVKDKNGNTFSVDINDSRYASGELVSVATGFIIVKDIYNNHFLLDKNNYDKSKYKFIWAGRRHNEESKRKIGNANRIHQTGKGNSNYGTCWIYNSKLKKSIIIKKENLNQWIDMGWIKGRKFLKWEKVKVKDKKGNILYVNNNDPRLISKELLDFKMGRIWIYNINSNITKLIDPIDLHIYLNEGWKSGRKL